MFRQDDKLWPDAEFITLHVALQKGERQEWKHKLDDLHIYNLMESSHPVARIQCVL